MERGEWEGKGRGGEQRGGWRKSRKGEKRENKGMEGGREGGREGRRKARNKKYVRFIQSNKNQGERVSDTLSARNKATQTGTKTARNTIPQCHSQKKQRH